MWQDAYSSKWNLALVRDRIVPTSSRRTQAGPSRKLPAALHLHLHVAPVLSKLNGESPRRSSPPLFLRVLEHASKCEHDHESTQYQWIGCTLNGCSHPPRSRVDLSRHGLAHGSSFVGSTPVSSLSESGGGGKTTQKQSHWCINTHMITFRYSLQNSGVFFCVILRPVCSLPSMRV